MANPRGPSLSLRFVGKTIEGLFANGKALLIRCGDGKGGSIADVKIGWVDANGELVEGRPVIIEQGAVIVAHDLADIINPKKARLVVNGRRN